MIRYNTEVSSRSYSYCENPCLISNYLSSTAWPDCRYCNAPVHNVVVRHNDSTGSVNKNSL